MDFTQETMIIIYWYGWAVWSLALLKKATWMDFFASIASGLIWPVGAPALLLKRILR